MQWSIIIWSLESELGLSGREILPVSGGFPLERRDKVVMLRIQNHLDSAWLVQVLWKICVPSGRLSVSPRASPPQAERARLNLAPRQAPIRSAEALLSSDGCSHGDTCLSSEFLGRYLPKHSSRPFRQPSIGSNTQHPCPAPSTSFLIT